MQTETVGGGEYYFLTFIEDFSGFTVVYLLKNKHEVFSKFKEYVSMTANKFCIKVQAIRSYNGGEYTGKELLAVKWGCRTEEPHFNGDGALSS